MPWLHKDKKQLSHMALGAKSWQTDQMCDSRGKVVLKTPFGRHNGRRDVGQGCLTAEAVQGASLALEGVHDVHGSDGLAASVLGVGHGITDHVLEEHLQDTTGLLVNESGDTLDATATGETTDSGLGNALDVVTKDLAVALGASLPETLASLSASRHVGREIKLRVVG